ncbi:MAG: branched-chain amino acid ABC transporter permease [Chitinophagales bacterium]
METIIQNIAGGLALGLLYALPALGIVLLWNTASFFNLAQGDFIALASYLMYFFFVLKHVGFGYSVLATMGIMVLFGLAVDGLILKPLRRFNANHFLILISTIGLSIFLKNAIRAIWGTQPQAIPNVFGKKPLIVLGAHVMPHSFWMMGVTVVLIAALYFFSTRTKVGVGMQATSQVRSAAQLMGINVGSMSALAFALNSLLAAVVGILASPILFLSPEMGDVLGTKAFAATIIGGFGNPVGTIFGGLLLGFTETFAAGYVSASYKEAITFALLIIFILFRPGGIFATRSTQKV